VPVAERPKSAREIARLKKAGQNVAPVVVEGRKIAASFWGKAWCDNLESYRIMPIAWSAAAAMSAMAR